MRLGVIDVGSNTVHLLIVGAHHGAAPSAAVTRKWELRLAEHLDEAGVVQSAAVERLITAMAECAQDVGQCDEVLAFATSAIRDATNGQAVLDRIRGETGIDLQVMTGEREAIVTFLAVRRWFGWSSGRLLVADIGGGSLELAIGADEHPDAAISLPLGAGRLTRLFITSQPPTIEELKALRKHVRRTFAGHLGELLHFGEPDRVVATSKTFRSLARICGVEQFAIGPNQNRVVTASALAKLIKRLERLSAVEVAKLPGVSPARAHQLLAGAIVAQEAMDLANIKHFEVCPWALREGLILDRLNRLAIDGN